MPIRFVARQAGYKLLTVKNQSGEIWLQSVCQRACRKMSYRETYTDDNTRSLNQGRVCRPLACPIT